MTEIYYFSGTGNTLAAAKEIAEGTGGAAIPIAALKEKETVVSGADAVGVAFPVYYAAVPVIVKEFMQKLGFSGRPYLFAVATYGGASGCAYTVLKDIARQKGYSFDACYGVHMPQNAWHKSWEKRELVLKNAKARAAKVAGWVNERKKGVFHTNAVMEFLLKPIGGPIMRASQKALARHAGGPCELELDCGIRLSDRAFTVSEACTGCGTCAEVCPADNIRMEGGRPFFQNRCENCLACYNWCPQKAIGGSITSGYYYRHPGVRIADMKIQKDKISALVCGRG